MFLALAQQIWKASTNNPDPALWPQAVNKVFRYRPIDLQRYVEQYWAAEADPSAREYYWSSKEVRRSMAEPARIGQAPETEVGAGRPKVPNVDALEPPNKVVWKHLIYSYLIENTRIVEVIRRVLHEIFHGERLGRPTEAVLNWAHLTERLVFSDRDGHWLNPPISEIRPDPGALRRNAYYRLFGMDLSHGLPDGRPYPYIKPEAANRDFVTTFETLLREVWRAFINRNNTSGTVTTDEARIADLCNRLENMLRVRRHAGSLSQHEFYCDAVMSWFHLTVSADNDVVYWLQAQAHDESTRLQAIADRVGVPAHTHSYEYFEMADYLHEILYRIERGDFSDPSKVAELYEGNDVDRQKQHQTTSKMTTIINHWSTATGRNLKEYAGGGDSWRSPLAAARTVPSLSPPRVTPLQALSTRTVTGG